LDRLLAKACPARRYHDRLAANLKVSAIVSPHLLAIEELELLSEPGVKWMSDAYAPMRILQDGISRRICRTTPLSAPSEPSL
jgi:hypothetical protein